MVSAQALYNSRFHINILNRYDQNATVWRSAVLNWLLTIVSHYSQFLLADSYHAPISNGLESSNTSSTYQAALYWTSLIADSAIYGKQSVELIDESGLYSTFMLNEQIFVSNHKKPNTWNKGRLADTTLEFPVSTKL